MKIKIQDKCRTVNGKPVKIGDQIDTDANTARNLIKKGFATPADSEAEKLNMDANSTLTGVQAQANIARILAHREKLAASQPARARA